MTNLDELIQELRNHPAVIDVTLTPEQRITVPPKLVVEVDDAIESSEKARIYRMLIDTQERLGEYDFAVRLNYGTEEEPDV